jgi:protein tyrosine phosphatase
MSPKRSENFGYLAFFNNDKRKMIIRQHFIYVVYFYFSAGIGRTGTLLTIDTCMKHIERGLEVIIDKNEDRIRSNVNDSCGNSYLLGIDNPI